MFRGPPQYGHLKKLGSLGEMYRNQVSWYVVLKGKMTMLLVIWHMGQTSSMPSIISLRVASVSSCSTCKPWGQEARQWWRTYHHVFREGSPLHEGDNEDEPRHQVTHGTFQNMPNCWICKWLYEEGRKLVDKAGNAIFDCDN